MSRKIIGNLMEEGAVFLDDEPPLFQEHTEQDR